MKGNSLAVTLSMARTVTGEFISNREGKLTAVTVSTVRAVTGEFLSNREGKLTYCDSVNGENMQLPGNSSQIMKGESLV